MYLIDTNIILELLLDQQRADEVESFLHRILTNEIFLSEFSLYSIGIILIKRKQYDTYTSFIDDLLISGGIRLIKLSLNEIENISNITQKFNLDFDDAYQYLIAEKYNLTIVSYDSDFDRTDKGRKTPPDIFTK